MSQWSWQITAVHRLILFIFLLILGNRVFAAEARVVLPGSVHPAVISQYVTPKSNYTPTAAPKIISPEEQAASFGPQGEHIKFTLKKVILEGNHVYSTAQLSTLY